MANGKVVMPLPIARFLSPSSPVEEDWEGYGTTLLNGFNRLLKSIYGHNMRLGTILAKHNFPDDQIARWRGDRVWLIRYLEHLEL